jgi:hypothetical protein
MRKSVNFRFDEAELEAWKDEAAKTGSDLTEFVEQQVNAATTKDAIRAQNKVAQAITAGKLEKQPCEECGNEKAVAHHDDYDKPLEVRWLCYRHHRLWHRDNPSMVKWPAQVRLANHLFEEIQILATKNNLSLTKQVAALLEQALGLSETEVGGGHSQENRAEGMASRGGATGAVTEKKDLGTSVSESPRIDPGICGMSNRHRSRSRQNPCPRCGYPT